jgi:hypothetical protein
MAIMNREIVDGQRQCSNDRIGGTKMAVAAKDGSMHHSAGRAKLHDEMASKGDKESSKPPMKKAASDKAGGEKKTGSHGPIPHDHPHMPGPHQTPSDTSIGEHVSEHGPATHVGHMHHEESGTHHVTTHHGGMGENMHHSEHESHEAAHDHMGEALGATESSDQGETPDEAEGVNENPAESASTAGGGNIPGLV